VNSIKTNKRYGFLASYQEHLRSFFPEESRHKIEVSTIHGYKGKESDVVVVLDAVEGSIPLIHPNWVFTRMFGDNLTQLNDDERRLFYVAVSRARERLILLTESRRESLYVKELQELKLAKLDWSKLPTPVYVHRDRLVVEVNDGYEIKEELKQRGFSYDGRKRVWRKHFGASDSDIAHLEANELRETKLTVKVIGANAGESQLS
jgi:DNA helicase-4